MLTAQSAYVAQCVGDVPSAEKAYKTLFSFKADLSPDVSAVAANNMLRIRGQRDFFDSWKKCKSNLSEVRSRMAGTRLAPGWGQGPGWGWQPMLR